MAPWQHCDLTIKGGEAALAEIMNAGFRMKKLAPKPDDVSQEDWERDVWGTHFEMNPTVDDDYQGRLHFPVSCAWCPPTKYCTFLMKKYELTWIKIVYEHQGEGGVILLNRTEEGEIEVTRHTWEEP